MNGTIEERIVSIWQVLFSGLKLQLTFLMMLLIDSMSNSDEIIIIWFKLLCFAGKQNNKGVFMMNNIPYTTKMLSTIFRRNEETVIKALKIFEEFGMIQYINGAITITNWGKHQNLDKVEANNEYMRNYMREYRKKQKAVATNKNKDKVNGKLNGKVNINSAEEEKELDLEKDIESEKSKTEDSISDETLSNLDYDSIINSFNSICKSLPNVQISLKRSKFLSPIFSFNSFGGQFVVTSIGSNSLYL